MNTDSIASWAPSRQICRQISKINEKDAVASESLNAHEEHDEEHEEEHAMDVAAEALAEAVVAAEMAEEEEEERVKENEKENLTQKIATPKKPKLNFFGVAHLKVTEEHLERKFSMRLKKMPVLFSPNGGDSESSSEEDDETEKEEKISNHVNNVHSAIKNKKMKSRLGSTVGLMSAPPISLTKSKESGNFERAAAMLKSNRKKRNARALKHIHQLQADYSSDKSKKKKKKKKKNIFSIVNQVEDLNDSQQASSSAAVVVPHPPLESSTTETIGDLELVADTVVGVNDVNEERSISQEKEDQDSGMNGRILMTVSHRNPRTGMEQVANTVAVAPKTPATREVMLENGYVFEPDNNTNNDTNDNNDDVVDDEDDVLGLKKREEEIYKIKVKNVKSDIRLNAINAIGGKSVWKNYTWKEKYETLQNTAVTSKSSITPSIIRTPIKKELSHKLTGREIMNWSSDTKKTSKNKITTKIDQVRINSTNNNSTKISPMAKSKTQKKKRKILPRSGTMNLGKVGTLIGLRSKKVITKKIHITRCESKEERFARIRADLKVSVNNIHCNYRYKYTYSFSNSID